MPTDIGFGFEMGFVFEFGEVVEGAAEVLVAESAFVEKDAGLIYFLGFPVAIETDLRDVEFSFFSSGGVVLPGFFGEALGGFGDSLFIGFIKVVGAIRTAAVVR